MVRLICGVYMVRLICDVYMMRLICGVYMPYGEVLYVVDMWVIGDGQVSFMWWTCGL